MTVGPSQLVVALYVRDGILASEELKKEDL
jgi:hypothetical protein